MSDTIVTTDIWKRTLASICSDKYSKARDRLRNCFISFRENASVLANEIHRSLPEFTVHDISHLDSLWEMTDIIIGKDYNLTPTEVFVLGGAILLHDLGMGLAAYPNGIVDIMNDVSWKDIITSLYLSRLKRIPSTDELTNPDLEIKNIAISYMLRKQHAPQAEKLATMYWKSASDESQIFLIGDIEIRQAFGRIIGKIANSHWWDINKVESEFSRVIGAPPWCPRDWTIDPLKIACILRVADASHIDARRAPLFLRTLRKLSLSSDAHWGFQEKLQKPYLKEDSLNYSSGHAFTYEEAPQWWLCYETLKLIDTELRQVDALLADKNLERFAAKRVFGIESPERLTSLIPICDWVPFDAFVHISDIPKIVKCLGGEELYGKNSTVAIRELIQNSSDAIRARRILENRDSNWGTVFVSCGEDNDGNWIQVEDNGIGMSINVIKNYLLNFGSSYWDSDLIREEYPGLLSKGIKQTGQYGIGFFSIFMIADRLQVITKQVNAAQADTYVLEFNDGINVRPMIRLATPNEYLRDGGTKVRIWIKNDKIKNNLFSSKLGELITLEELCLSIAPSLDCELVIIERDNRISYESNYWIKCDNNQFYDLLVKSGKRNRSIKDEKKQAIEMNKIYSDSIKKNFRLIDDCNGEVYGRACIAFPQHYYSNTFKYLTGLLTIGGLTSTVLTGIVGILKGKTLTAARDTSELLVPKSIISCWASIQATLLKNFNLDDINLLEYSQIIRMLNGKNPDIVVAKDINNWINYEELVILLKNHDEIFVVNNYILSKYDKILTDIRFNKNVFFTICSSAPVIFQNSHSHGFYNTDIKNWQYNYTNIGFFIDAISESWDIDINVLLKSSDSSMKTDVCIGKSTEIEIIESAFVFSKSILKNI